MTVAMPAVTVRPATPGDAAACALVHYTSWVETYTGLASAEFWERASLERSTTIWRRWLDDALPVVVGVVDGRVAGLALVGDGRENNGHPPVRDRELYQLYVLASDHGTGVGQMLLDRVLPAGTPAQLWVAEHNPRARRFYERNGFGADGATDPGGSFGGIAALRLVR
jgi:ribosomal protein S18 acetylase RimI-like enzyme